MVIREARLSDAEAMSRVFIASITELCARDHGGRADHIAQWTANKAPQSIRGWLGSPATHIFVAERDGSIVAVGSFNEAGEIQSNYVAPEARFAGVSKAMLAHMEAAMRECGMDEARLTSTTTAHDFYRAAGWVDDGPPRERFGVKAYPMQKMLSAPVTRAANA